jgi:hypothetical protein
MSPPRRDNRPRKDVLVYTVHKAASSFLNRLITKVTNYLRIDHHSINRQNSEEIIETGWKHWIETGSKRGCFGPIRLRKESPCVPDDLDRYSVVAHMRDPRDVLTSLFFSHTYSHNRGIFDLGDEARRTWEADGIDRYVLDRAVHGEEDFRGRYDVFCSQLAGRENVLVLRYEDLVSDYRTWLAQFLTVFSDWADDDAPPGSERTSRRSLAAVHRRFYDKFQDEFTVPAEDIHRHKRQVTPGDHRRKLKPETIEKLNAIFADVLHLLGYDAEQPPQIGMAA